MTTTLDDLKNFDVQGATLTFWAVRRSIPTGRPPVFTPRHVATTTELDEKLRSAMKNEFSRIEEVQEYGLLTENNESSALSIAAEDTHVGQIVDKTVEDTAQNRADGLDKIKNSFCYVIKLVSGDAVVRGVCKTDASWQIRKSESWIPVFFRSDELGIEPAPTMHISQRVDFIVADDTIFVLNKAKFESVLSYKQAHQEDFEGLLAENEFVDVFSKTDALVSYVGENKIQLRRASAIRHKGHYKDPGFMENLRRHHANYQLNIDFDEEGRIIATPSTCKDIVQALLDHRLASGFSRNVYDVPDVKRVRR